MFGPGFPFGKVQGSLAGAFRVGPGPPLIKVPRPCRTAFPNFAWSRGRSLLNSECIFCDRPSGVYGECSRPISVVFLTTDIDRLSLRRPSQSRATIYYLHR